MTVFHQETGKGTVQEDTGVLRLMTCLLFTCGSSPFLCFNNLLVLFPSCFAGQGDGAHVIGAAMALQLFLVFKLWSPLCSYLLYIQFESFFFFFFLFSLGCFLNYLNKCLLHAFYCQLCLDGQSSLYLSIRLEICVNIA